MVGNMLKVNNKDRRNAPLMLYFTPFLGVLSVFVSDLEQLNACWKCRHRSSHRKSSECNEVYMTYFLQQLEV